MLHPKKGYVKRGKRIHFRATLRNEGTVDAVNAQLCERIPKGMKFIGAPGRETKKNKRLVCWSNSRMAAGTAVTGTMTLKAKKKAKIGVRKNRVVIKAANSPAKRAKVKFHVGTKKQNKQAKKNRS